MYWQVCSVYRTRSRGSITHFALPSAKNWVSKYSAYGSGVTLSNG